MKTKTVWVVWLIIITVGVLFPLQLLLDFPLPFGGALYALMFIVGGYVGFDQFSTVVASRKMPTGFKYTGSYKKLFFIVIGMWILLIEAIIFQAILTTIQLPLDQMFVAVGIVSGLFAGGNKLNNAAEKDSIIIGTLYTTEKEGGS